MLTINVDHNIWDIVTHKVSKKESLVIWYEYVEWYWIRYVIIWDDEKQTYALWYELCCKQEWLNIWFIYN